MRLLWLGEWIEAPSYATPTAGALIQVDAMLPVGRVHNASGRVIEDRYRKLIAFAVHDGVLSAARKGLAKRRTSQYVGDYRVALALGRIGDQGGGLIGADDVGTSVVALAGRVPPCAELIPVHSDLVVELGSRSADREFLSAVWSAFSRKEEVVLALAADSFLYSGRQPPPWLLDVFDTAVRQAQSTVASRTDHEPAPSAEEALSPGPSGASGGRIVRSGPSVSAALPLALLGAGDHARTQIVPAAKAAGLTLHVIADREAQVAALAARGQHFASATCDASQAIEELPGRGLVVVATGHDSHAALAAEGARAGHRVIVEKPPVVTRMDLQTLRDAWLKHPGQLDVAFNRRLHPLCGRARELLDEERGPLTVTCSIKEVALEPDHWYFWPNQGTRVTGNLCHWIDLAIYLMRARAAPVALTVSSPVVDQARATDEERTFSVTFTDGSLLTIVASSRGDGTLGVQELIEVRRGGATVTIEDLARLRIRRRGHERVIRRPWRRKDAGAMYRELFAGAIEGRPPTYPLRDLVLTSAVQIEAAGLVATGGDSMTFAGAWDWDAWLRPASGS